MKSIMGILVSIVLIKATFIITFSYSMPISQDLQAKSLFLLVNDGTYQVTMRRSVKFYSMATKQHLRIQGTSIDGLGKSSSPDARLIIESVGFGLVRIKAVTGNYLCFTQKGNLVSKIKDINQHCIFREIFDIFDFHNYQSFVNNSWYLGMRKNGKPKRGPKTLRNHKESQFLLRSW